MYKNVLLVVGGLLAAGLGIKGLAGHFKAKGKAFSPAPVKKDETAGSEIPGFDGSPKNE